MNICQCRSVFNKANIKINRITIFKKYASCLINDNKRNLTTPSQQTHKIEEVKDKSIKSKKNKDKFPVNGPDLKYFIEKWSSNAKNVDLAKLTKMDYKYLSHPYISLDDVKGYGRKVFFRVYGCQMNVSDADVAWGILKTHDYELANNEIEADVILFVTCSIRDKAEEKIWTELAKLRKYSKHKKIGILGCMAERLRSEIINKNKIVDIVVGPDSYKDLPRLLAISYEGDKAVNVMLSYDETYADVTPVVVSPSNVSAYVSIMRGCDNMCTYCIVPFTRGKERSRGVDSIINEITHLYDSGIKQVTLLGQNVNSYNDISEATNYSVPINTAKGFSTIYKPKQAGLRFADLLDKVSSISDELRVRFTSPHPKDFPDEVLQIMKERDNICNCIHLPAQSGNSRILDIMGRGYTRESYLELVSHIRSKLPTVALTSDIICGFCSETEDEFQDTMSLVQQVSYTFLYTFQYSLREKTVAHRKYVDDVPTAVKQERLARLSEHFRIEAGENNLKEVGKRHLILVQGRSLRSEEQLHGRNDWNLQTIIPRQKVIVAGTGEFRIPQPGDYVEVEITDATSQSLRANPVCITTMSDYFKSQYN